jgi:Ca2+-binding RTX toxin-like protein
MGAVITCQANVNCVGTEQADVISSLGTGSIAIIQALGGSDVIYGSSEVDRIDGGRGDDIIYGASGNDQLDGGRGAGTDFIDGGAGIDLILGQDGDDNLAGGPDSDDIIGGSSTDTIYGGPGPDRIYNNDYAYNNRDFAKDIIDCGSDATDGVAIRSSDGDIAANNCERVVDYDG